MDKENLISLYKQGLSIPQISITLCKSQSTVRYHLKKLNILRSRADGVRLAAKNGRLSSNKGISRVFTNEWKCNISKAKQKKADETAKGVSLKPSGYYEITRGENKGRSLHVMIFEKRLGRRLLNDECIHHIDGDKTNNDINNLALMTRSAHARLHRHEDKLSNKLRARNNNGTWS